MSKYNYILNFLQKTTLGKNDPWGGMNECEIEREREKTKCNENVMRTELHKKNEMKRYISTNTSKSITIFICKI